MTATQARAKHTRMISLHPRRSTVNAFLARIAHGSHSGRVLNLALQRAVSLILILALIAGVQMRLVPMAMTSLDMRMAKMASDDSGACKGCAPGKMPVRDCDAICAAIVAVLDNFGEPSRVARPALWARSNDPLRLHSFTPDTDPLRS